MTSLSTTKKETIYLDGNTLDVDSLVLLSSGKYNIDLTEESWNKVKAGREVVDNIVESGEVAYGINTGFGLFSKVVVTKEQLHDLQVNLILSHSSGVGEPLSRQRTRMLLALRTNVLSKGYSGISVKSLKQVIAAFNKDCLSVVPCKGTVGASGDLAPLSHLALGLMGIGDMWYPNEDDDNNNDNNVNKVGKASDILSANGLTPLHLEAKEGLAMINGTQLITSLGAEAVQRSRQACICADIAVALSLEVLKGTPKAYHPCIHSVRRHRGQNLVAERLRNLLTPATPSEIYSQHRYVGKVQDAYTLRCAPQVHGIAHDTVEFVSSIISTEMNSATDNPMVFTGEINNENLLGGREEDDNNNNGNQTASSLLNDDDDNGKEDPVDPNQVEDLQEAKAEIVRLRNLLAKQQVVTSPSKATSVQQSNLKKWGIYKQESDTYYTGGGGFVISGGNFHGEYPAKALDYLAIGISELASISERRIERLCNPDLSGLPAFLVKNGGFHSGFMIAHCTAAALVSENKVLVHPSSTDSLSTSGAKEDHVSMGGFAARKSLEVVSHVEIVLAIEILAACQALEFFKPLKTTEPLQNVYNLVRTKVKPWDRDRHMSPDIEAVVELLRSGQLVDAVGKWIHVDKENSDLWYHS